MTDFDYEVKQKKSLVPSARRRKGGSKSKKCSLPSDNLTEAEKRKLNGPVCTVKMGQPMTWAELKGLPDTLRRPYLQNLVDTYEASWRMLGDMLGVSQVTAGNELRRLGIQSGPAHGRGSRGAVVERRKAMWDAFCNGVVGGNSIKPTENEQVEPADAQVENAGVQIVSEDAQVEDAEVQIVSEDAKVEDAEIVAQDEAHEPELAETDAETETENHGEGDTARTEEAPWIYPARLAMEYDGCADAVYANIGKLMSLYGGNRVHVKVIIGAQNEGGHKK